MPGSWKLGAGAHLDGIHPLAGSCTAPQSPVCDTRGGTQSPGPSSSPLSVGLHCALGPLSSQAQALLSENESRTCLSVCISWETRDTSTTTWPSISLSPVLGFYFVFFLFIFLFCLLLLAFGFGRVEPPTASPLGIASSAFLPGS